MKKLSSALYYIFLIYVLLCSCKDNDVEAEKISFELDGLYDLISLTSTLAVDLDHDGILSTDILAETRTLTEPTFFKNRDRYYLELKTDVYDWTGQPRFYDQQLIVRAPLTGVVYDSDDNFLYTDYASTMLLSTYRFNERTKQIVITNGANPDGIILSASSIENGLLVSFKQWYFTNDWVSLTLIGEYKRRV